MNSISMADKVAIEIGTPTVPCDVIMEVVGWSVLYGPTFDSRLFHDSLVLVVCFFGIFLQLLHGRCRRLSNFQRA